jgi:hypothetical protein
MMASLGRSAIGIMATQGGSSSSPISPVNEVLTEGAKRSGKKRK